MIVKFHSYGSGLAKDALNYLLKEKAPRPAGNLKKKRVPLSPRAHARVLSGDPVVTEQLIDTTAFKQKYKSGVLSFEKRADELTEKQKFEIMQKFEDVIFCGLERDQYDILWIEHADKDIDSKHPVGRLELNFLIPGQELRSGRRLQPFYAGADMVRVNAFKDVVNYNYKLADPNEPKRKRLINPYDNTLPTPTPYDEPSYNRQSAKKDEEVIADPPDRRRLREAIARRMKFESQQNTLRNRQSVLYFLNKWGLNIERHTSKNSVSVSSPHILDKNNKPLHIRLTGALYQLNFNSIYHEPHIVISQQKAYASRAPRAYEYAKKTLEKGIEIKKVYHSELYTDVALPEPLILNVVDIPLQNIVEPPMLAPVEPKNDGHSLDIGY